METFRYHSVTISITEDAEPFTSWLTAGNFSRYVLITDSNCYKLVWPLLKKKIRELKKAELIVIKPGEKHKHLDTAQHIIKKLTKLAIDKHALVINLGGGVVSDLGGFVASVYKRGIHYVNIPTSFLAMVDAAIGSKTAVDFNTYKNYIGTIYHPKYVWINTALLNTLPFDEIMNGLAESFKHGLIDSQTHLDIVTEQFERLNLNLIIQQSVAFKCETVEQDLYDVDRRHILNLGHTTGHAIEALLLKRKYPVMHGMCVFYGLITALLISEKRYDFPKEKSNKIIQQIKRYCPILPLKKSDIKTIIRYMYNDKKNSDGEIRMVLLEDIGAPLWNIPVKASVIEDTLTATIEIMSA
jgi:3-dehydroquinate synthase